MLASEPSKIPGGSRVRRPGTIFSLVADMLDTAHAIQSSADETRNLPSLDQVLPNGDPLEGTFRELIAVARRAIDTVRGGSRVSAKVQAQARAVVDELGHALRDAGARAPAVLRIATDGTWFEIDGQHVDVARRGAVRRILSGLASAREEKAGRSLSVDDLFQIGWPGERIPYESQVRRVYTAIWTLRTLGLDGTLLTRDEGYMLDPRRDVARSA